MKTTVKNEIDLIDQVYTGHKIPKDTLARWLSDVDASVARQILLVDDYKPDYSYTEAPDTELLVSEAPWRRIYFLYLSAMIDFVLKQYNTYANELAEYNNAIADYKHYIVTKYNPASKSTAERAGYYISPYALAVKHGFVGTEEEWIHSMIPAEAVKMLRMTESVSFALDNGEQCEAKGKVRFQGDVAYVQLELSGTGAGAEIDETGDECICDCTVLDSNGIWRGFTHVCGISISLEVRDKKVKMITKAVYGTAPIPEATLTIVLLPEKG